MQFSLKHVSLRHYIRHVRRQSKHVQHVHAFVFAGTITLIAAAIILYTDYGFWHERYHAEDLTGEKNVSFESESPGESFLSFLREAKDRMSSFGSLGGDLLDGTETYKKEE